MMGVIPIDLVFDHHGNPVMVMLALIQLLHCLPNSACAAANSTEIGEQLGNIVVLHYI